MNKVTNKKIFHFWNSFNFLVVVLIIAVLIIRFGDRTKIIKATEISRLVHNWLAFACGFACIAYFIVLRKKCGKLTGDIIWLIGGVWMVIHGILVHFSIKNFGLDAFPIEIYIIIHAICMLVLVSFLSINAMITINCFLKQKKGVDYAIIHGAKVGSVALNNRIDAAALYLQDKPNTMAIASGGKGSDEEISEAEYISNRLKNQNIPADHILLEDKSTTTYENLAYSSKYIKDKAPFMVVTDDYHILRARLLGRKVYGYMPEGLPVHTSLVSLPYYVLREYLSLIVNSIRGNLF